MKYREITEKAKPKSSKTSCPSANLPTTHLNGLP